MAPFPVAYENSNFRLDWYALRVPIFTIKAFPCPCNLDQKRLLEVKQLVWVQNRPLLQYKIQIRDLLVRTINNSWIYLPLRMVL